MRILGLDVGQKRVGIAVSDPLGWIAQPLQVLERSDPETELAAYKAIIAEYEVEKAVLGYPINMNGSIGAKAREIEAYADWLRASLKVEIAFIDERLTTVSAEKMLLRADVSRKKRRCVIDKIAAVHILQSYLDRQASK